MPDSLIARALLFSILTTVLAWLGFHFAAPSTGPAPSTAPASMLPKPGPVMKVTTDAAEVFQKGFWKRPTAADHILHAERREWQDKGGVNRWQWFIVVEPSPELVRHLITDNAFSLTASSQPIATESSNAPAWFPKRDAADQVLVNPGRTFVIHWNPAANRLTATDAGGGFRAGAPEVSKPPQPLAATEGRLPRTPPPNPNAGP